MLLGLMTPSKFGCTNICTIYGGILAGVKVENSDNLRLKAPVTRRKAPDVYATGST